MGLRDMVEEALNKAIDKIADPAKVKKKLHELVDKIPDEKIVAAVHKFKAEVVDLIDGEDDIK